MGANLSKWDGARSKQPNEMRSRDVQEVSSLLRRQFGVNGNDSYSVPLRQMTKEFEKENVRGAWNGNLDARATSLHRQLDAAKGP